MNKEKLEYFRKKLIKEKDNVHDLLHQMEENEAYSSKVEFSTELSELSMYDNHPSDTATEIFDQERGRALREHEITILKKIDEAINNIDSGKYGKCSRCGVDIAEERLEFIPYTEFCVNCQSEINDIRPLEKNNRPVEEEVIYPPFGYGFNDYDLDNQVGYDAEDSYQDVQKYDFRSNVDFEFIDDDLDFVDPLDRISNQQYRNQLPD